MTARYFTDKETAGLDPLLVDMLDEARHMAGVPFIITCGVRTPERNAELEASGAVTDSEHITGEAVDLRCTSSMNCFEIVSALMAVGLRRIVIGIKPGGKSQDEFYHNIHAGISTDKPSPVLSIKLY